jgi:hypothetical protein
MGIKVILDATKKPIRTSQLLAEETIDNQINHSREPP